MVDAAPAQTSTLSVGDSGIGIGMLTIQNGGTVTSASAATSSSVGNDAGSTGILTIDGPGSSYTNTLTQLVDGNLGTGTLTIRNGATANTSGGRIGDQGTGTGTVTVRGSGSSWTGLDDLYVGRQGNGTLNIQNGGSVGSNFGYVGSNTGSTGTATVSGQGSTWNVSQDLNVGSNGVATLTVRNGGRVNVGGELRIARFANSIGTINIGAASVQAAAAPGTLNAAGVEFGLGNGLLFFNHTSSNYDFAPTSATA